MTSYTVDRIEDGGIARLEREDLVFIDVKLSELPEGTAQGDCLVEHDGEWRLDPEETALRRARIAQKMKAVFE